jgi:hypothetical protein
MGAGQSRSLPEDRIRYSTWGEWLPDGKSFLIAGAEEGHGRRVYVRDTEGGPARPVTPEGVQVHIRSSGGAVTPDGRAFAARSPEGRTVLYPIDGGGEPRPLAGIEAGEVPVQWAAEPDILFVCETRELPARIFRVNVRTGKRDLARQLAPLDAAGVSSIDQIRLTADGKSYVYSYRRLLSDLYVVEGLK